MSGFKLGFRIGFLVCGLLVFLWWRDQHLQFLERLAIVEQRRADRARRERNIDDWVEDITL